MLSRAAVRVAAAILAASAGLSVSQGSAAPTRTTPVIASISPSSATAGGPAFTLHVAGSGFSSSSKVRWNGSNRTTAFINSGALTAQITAADIASPGADSVTVFNNGSGGRLSNAATFTVAPAPNPIPVVASISPSSATAGGAAFTLQVFGAGFVAVSTVQWNGSGRPTTFVSSSSLTAQISSVDIASTGTASVRVFNSGPGGGISNASTFTIIAVSPNPAPAIVSISPSSATAGGGGFTLQLLGSGFVAVSTAQWNGSDRPTAFVSSTALNAQISSADIASPGAASVTVFNPGPGGGLSNASTFTVAAAGPEPVIFSLSPSSAAPSGAGLVLVVFGGGFVSSSTLLWNDAPRPTVFIDTGTLSVRLLCGDLEAAGPAFVKVSNPGGAQSNAAAFTVAGAAQVGRTLLCDTFPGPDRLITNEYAFWNPTDPARVESSTWQMDSGSVFNASSAAWTGVPDAANPNPTSSNGTDSAVFRLTNRVSDFADESISFGLFNQGLSTTSFTPAVAWDGVQVFLRYQDQTRLYYIAVNRRDNNIVIKKKTPPGPDNGGTYYELTPYVPHPVPYNRWQNIVVTAKNMDDGSVALQGFIDGFLVLNAIDNGTFGGPPIRRQGKVGIRGDNCNFRFDDFAVIGATVASNPGPSLAALDPSSEATGTAGFTLQVIGAGFVSSSTVRWNGFNRSTTFVTTGTLTVRIPSSDIASSGTALVTVFNPAPGGGTSDAKSFVVGSNPAPAIASISPSSAAAGGPGFALQVLGSGFISTSTVHWNGSNRPTTFIATTTLSAQIGPTDVAAAGTAAVTVFNPAPGGGQSDASTFTVTGSGPAAIATEDTPFRALPNPWRAGADTGTPITFDALVPDTTVKLFEASGRLVRTLRATGRTALWDLTDESGKPAASGVYTYSATVLRDRQIAGTLTVIR